MNVLLELSYMDSFICLFQSSFIGAIAIGDLIKSTLGPKGMVTKNVHLYPSVEHIILLLFDTVQSHSLVHNLHVTQTYSAS